MKTLPCKNSEFVHQSQHDLIVFPPYATGPEPKNLESPLHFQCASKIVCVSIFHASEQPKLDGVSVFCCVGEPPAQISPGQLSELDLPTDGFSCGVKWDFEVEVGMSEVGIVGICQVPSEDRNQFDPYLSYLLFDANLVWTCLVLGHHTSRMRNIPS